MQAFMVSVLLIEMKIFKKNKVISEISEKLVHGNI